ncbi:MAG: RedB protein [Planctomycetota bacterium]
MRIEIPYKLWIAPTCWVLCIGVGLGLAIEHDNRPALTTNPPAELPTQSISQGPDSSLLMLFVHPHCPCSRASLSEFASILQASRQPLTSQIVFVKPAGASAGWEKSPLWDVASEIPGVTVICDCDGRLASKFQVTTSGHAVLYDKFGQLIFSGGITASRGHYVSNSASDSLIALVNNESSTQQCSPVFGCLLVNQPITPLEALSP